MRVDVDIKNLDWFAKTVIELNNAMETQDGIAIESMNDTDIGMLKGLEMAIEILMGNLKAEEEQEED